jgi:LPXTG-site transpeptidase (sortase) family protein
MKNTTWVKLACAGGMALAGVAVAIQVLAAPSGWLKVDGNIRFAGGGGTVDWANAGPAGAACANGGVNVTGSGGLFNCGRLGAGSNPPIAPLLVRTDPSIISAVFIVDPIVGDAVTGCAANDPTTNGGGQKNGDAISTYTYGGAGGFPAKDDLSDVYAVTHTRSDNGHPEIYFGAEKLTQNGDTHMDFEFLQSAVSLTGNCLSGGGFVGNRTQGDLLVSVDFAGGGSAPAFSVHQWHCAADPGLQPADGTVCNPSGGPEHYQLIAAPFAAVTVNTVDIDCGGWVCRDQDLAPDTTKVRAFNFMEGGVDLSGIPFAGCFTTFIPHTRTSGSFDAALVDFAGPVALKSCRDPSSNSSPGGTISAGTSVHDVAALTNGGAPPPAGTVTFFLCQPAQVTSTGCLTGTQVGASKALVAGIATSDPTTNTNTAGKYCWRTVFTPAPGSGGIYTTTPHTNSTTECFNVVVAASLPDTGLPEIAAPSLTPAAPILVVVAMLPLLAWRRGRSVAALLVAGLVLGASPAAAPAAQATIKASTAVAAANPTVVSSPAPLQLATMAVRESGWRLVIPRIGVDAPIAPVGRDRNGAMASPASLDGVGWFNRGPAPGQPGDAVIDGHYGVEQPAVFRKLHFLRPGDEVDVVWPDGHTTYFQVTSLQRVPADSHPTGLFSRAGPSSLSLITCAGAWLPARATYSERLIVTAMLS